MKCPGCQTENPDDNRFCRECGVKLSVMCPQCEAEVLAGDKFCGKCGQRLGAALEPLPKDLSFDEKLNKIQRYLPEGLTEKILSQRNKIEGERKQITVLFCDMEGFTALVEKFGPEEAYDIMDHVYEILIHKVHDYEGTVNEMTGDGLLALFGAPIALEDAPQRAIRSAHAIHREMAKLSETFGKERGTPPLKMRIGIHTGPVVVGTLGNNLRVEFKAVGDTVNLASRMEGLAEPGTTYVTGETFKLTEGLFRFESLGEKQVKGKEAPVAVYRVIAPSTRRTRFDVSAERGLTPFVGRERELELLLDSFERAKAGRGQAFSIMAEAGVGKSRLLYEFRKAIANEDVTFLEGKCLSFSRGVAYHPVIDILKSTFDIMEGDTDSRIREKVTNRLQEWRVEKASILPYVLELFSVKDSSIQKISMSAEARKDRIMEAVKRIAIQGSKMRTLVIAIEDLHWMDTSSEDYLKTLLDAISGARVLLILTYRPEYAPTWSTKTYHNHITLNRLSNRESLVMVHHLLGTQDVEGGLEEFVLEKTEGVPFFIEELIKALNELNFIGKSAGFYRLSKKIEDVRVPSTIQDVIMARVDVLPEKAREALQTGSVIEREFDYQLLKMVMDMSEKDLLSRLSLLKDSELLYERGIYPQSTYVFRHALTREVIYDSILPKKRKNLHAAVGKAMEQLYESSIEDHYAVLAEHFIEAEDYQKAENYLHNAGRKAEKAGALSDSIIHAQKRVVCLENLPRSRDKLKTLVDARTALGLYLFQLFCFAEAREAVDPVFESALGLGDKKRIAQIYTIMGAYECWVTEDLSKALTCLKDALRISQEERDMVSAFFANVWLGNALFFGAEFQKAIEYMQRALDLNIAANNLWGISVIQGSIAMYHLWHGNVQLGLKMSEKALETAEQSGDIYSRSYAYKYHGDSLMFSGNLREAEKYFLKAIDLSMQINGIVQAAMTHMDLGYAYFTLTDFEQSEYHHQCAISLTKRSRATPSLISLCELNIARARVLRNDRDLDLAFYTECIRRNRLPLYASRVRRHMAEILLTVGNGQLSVAEHWIREAIDHDLSMQLAWDLAQDYVVFSEIQMKKGDSAEGRNCVRRALKIFEQCGADGWVEKYRRELAVVS